MKRVPLERIRPNPFQTRSKDDREHIYTLAQDIKANGLLEMPAGRAVSADGQPVTYDETCQVQLAFGHNRWKAYQLLSVDDDKYADLPVQIVTYDDERMALAAWSENENRKNLNPVERARAVLRMIETFAWTQDQAADKVRVARSTVSNMLRMLRLPEDVLDPLAEGVISERQAMAMMPFYDLGKLQRGLCLDDADFAEFMQVARQGMVDSETIRKKVTVKIEEHWPKDPPPPGLFDQGLTPPALTLPSVASPTELGEGNEQAVIIEKPEWIAEVDITPSNSAAASEMVGEENWEPVLQPNDPPFDGSSTLTDQGSVKEPLKSVGSEAAPADPLPEGAREKEVPPPPSVQASPSASPPPATKTWSQSTILLTMTLMPEDRNQDNRLVIIGGRINDGAPIIEQRRLYAMDMGRDLTVLLAQLMDRYEEEHK